LPVRTVSRDVSGALFQRFVLNAKLFPFEHQTLVLGIQVGAFSHGAIISHE
jgi:hypothetical protein